MSFVTIALFSLRARHDFLPVRRRPRHADIGHRPVEVGFLARLPKRTKPERAASIASSHAEMGPLRAWQSVRRRFES
ncbi:hypothetical protein [Burkholderia sp. AU45388]|uniref:hypothetical protein n=1 Tax=Burkholderia sp. AU45388 TaxID=3059206 RepID=UPI0026538D20|nr:hypothetical protein [Burkholderia sp. AU45388]MDN7431335.1 hypothetical protein [Burkholderia sp. AU45388]